MSRCITCFVVPFRSCIFENATVASAAGFAASRAASGHISKRHGLELPSTGPHALNSPSPPVPTFKVTSVLCQIPTPFERVPPQPLSVMKLVLPAFLALLLSLAQGAEASRRSVLAEIPQITSALESRQGRCNITAKEDVDCVIHPRRPTRVIRTLQPGTSLPVTCQTRGRESEPYVHEMHTVIPDKIPLLTVRHRLSGPGTTSRNGIAMLAANSPATTVRVGFAKHTPVLLSCQC